MAKIKRNRFPRLAFEVPDNIKPAVEALEVEAADLIEPVLRGYKANVAIGRVFRKLQEIIGWGNWKHYYAAKYGTSGISLRLARTYIQLAEDEDKAAKAGDSPALEDRPSAVDEQEIEIHVANVKAKLREAGRPRPYNISLVLTPEEREATEVLKKARMCWLRARREMKDVLRKHLGMPVRFPRREIRRFPRLAEVKHEDTAA